MPTTISATFRPLTSTLSPSVLAVIRCYVPARVEEHLVQGWDALSVAGDTADPLLFSRNMAFARTRLDHARAGLPRIRKTKERALAAAEVEHFARLIEGTR